MDTLTWSCEFFPPKTEDGEKKLLETSNALAALDPHFFSVTFGAGGSTRHKTREIVDALRHHTPVSIAPHLSCIGTDKTMLREILLNYKTRGIQQLVALRGDIPSGMGYAGGELNHASDLVTFIRQETGDHFRINVAAYPEFHPEANNANKDMEYFKRKVQAGANAAITQYFYNSDAYFRFVEACEQKGINIPIVPGIMPITHVDRLVRFSKQCGAEIPLWLLKRLSAYGEDENAMREFGVEVITRLCDTLLMGGAPGLHFYTLNQSEPTYTICNNLGLVNKKLSLKNLENLTQ